MPQQYRAVRRFGSRRTGIVWPSVWRQQAEGAADCRQHRQATGIIIGRSAERGAPHARNTNYSYARPSGDCCGPVVGLSSLTKVHRIAANIAKLPELLQQKA